MYFQQARINNAKPARLLRAHFRAARGAIRSAGRRWETPRLLLTADSSDHWIDPDGSFWRAMSFIEDSRIVRFGPQPRACNRGRVCHRAFPHPCERPACRQAQGHTGRLPHHPALSAALSGRCWKNAAPRHPPMTAYCMDFIDRRKEFAPVLENAKADGKTAAADNTRRS